jgi:ABC-2 type transport system ATP-binding protein
MTDAVLHAIDLVMRYKDVRVLNGLNLEVAEGSVFGLIGANGAGKTTTIKTFMNILTPTRGRCEVLGINSRELRDDDFAQIGYVSETRRCRAG